MKRIKSEIPSKDDFDEKYLMGLKNYVARTMKDIKLTIFKEIWISIYIFSKIEDIDIKNSEDFQLLMKSFSDKYSFEDKKYGDFLTFVLGKEEEIFLMRKKKELSETALYERYFRKLKKKLSKGVVEQWLKPHLEKANNLYKRLLTLERNSEIWYDNYKNIIEEKHNIIAKLN